MENHLHLSLWEKPEYYQKFFTILKIYVYGHLEVTQPVPSLQNRSIYLYSEIVSCTISSSLFFAFCCFPLVSMVNFSTIRWSCQSLNWAKSSQQNYSMSHILFYILYMQHWNNILFQCLRKWQIFHINVMKNSVFIHIPLRKESVNLKKSWKEIEKRNDQ